MAKIEYVGRTILEQFGGKRITITLDGEQISGAVLGLDANGWLTLRTDDGLIRYLNGAQASEIRPHWATGGTIKGDVA